MRQKKINPTPEQLSDRERAALCFIQQFPSQHHSAPTQRDIALGIGLSLSATHDLIQRLIEYGYLSRWRDGRRARNLRVRRSLSG